MPFLGAAMQPKAENLSPMAMELKNSCFIIAEFRWRGRFTKRRSTLLGLSIATVVEEIETKTIEEVEVLDTKPCCTILA